MPTLLRFFAILFAALLGLHAGGAAAQGAPLENEFRIGELGVLVLPIPQGWQPSVYPATEGRPVTLVLKPKAGDPFEILMTPIRPKAQDANVSDLEGIRRQVQRVATRTHSQAVEADLIVREITGPKVRGAYFTATDKAPKPGEYLRMAQGMLTYGDLHATFTVLTNQGQDAVVADAIQMLKASAFRPGK